MKATDQRLEILQTQPDQWQAIADARERQERGDHEDFIWDGKRFRASQSRANNEMWFLSDEYTLDDKGELVHTKIDPPRHVIFPADRFKRAKPTEERWVIAGVICAILLLLWSLYVLSCGAIVAGECIR
jgi:hypothetical protein